MTKLADLWDKWALNISLFTLLVTVVNFFTLHSIPIYIAVFGVDAFSFVGRRVFRRVLNRAKS